VTSAIVGPRTTAHLDDVLAGAGIVLQDEILNRIDEIVPPGTDIGAIEANCNPPAISQAELRRRPTADARRRGERSAG
jgi:aryl-alcohol dehydrogenase (NADP+)